MITDLFLLSILATIAFLVVFWFCVWINKRGLSTHANGGDIVLTIQVIAWLVFAGLSAVVTWTSMFSR